MEIQNLTESSEFLVSFELVLTGKAWTEYLKKASAAIQKNKNIPGYRAGKAPLALVAKVAGELLFEEAGNNAAADSIDQFCAENRYSPVTPPEIRIAQADLSTLRVACSFVNYPHTDELAYRGLAAQKPIRTCTEQDIDEAIHHYMGQNLYVHEVDREARMGDIAEVSFTGTCEGKHFPYDHSDGARFDIGSGQLFTGLDEALLGHKAGDELTLQLTMPADFHREKLRGKTLDLNVRLKSVTARERLECTDEYVREHIRGCQTLADFREQNRRQLQSRSDAQSEQVFMKRLEKALAAAVPCSIPESMIATVAARYETQMEILAASEETTVEKLLAREGRTIEQFRAQVRPYAEQQVRLSIALDHIAEKEAITVTPAEIDDYFRNLARAQGMSAEMVRQREGGDGAAIEQLRSRKAMQIVRDNAECILVDVDTIPAE